MKKSFKGLHLKIVLDLTTFKNKKTGKPINADLYAKIDLLALTTKAKAVDLLRMIRNDEEIPEEIKTKIQKTGIVIPSFEMPSMPASRQPAAALAGKSSCVGSLTLR